MDKFEIISKNYCSGCGLCAALCSQKAIVMSEDEEGFVYPKIDFTVCIHCNVCRKNCVMHIN